MKHLSFNRFAGVSGILSALLYIVSIVGMQYYMALDHSSMDAMTQGMQDNHIMMLLYGWPGIIATILILPLVYAFHRFNQAQNEYSKLALLMTTIGLCFVLIGYLFHLALTYFHAPIYQTLDAIQRVSFGSLISATIGVQDMFWLSGDLFAFLGIALLLILNLGEKSFPKWLVLMCAIAGLLAAVGSFGFIPAFKESGISFLFIGGFSVFAIWEVLIGLRLFKTNNASQS